MDTSTRWLVIRPRNNAAETELAAYLYGHTTPVHTHNQGFGDTVVAVVIDLNAGNRVEYLADYQAERLRSGGHRADVWETYAEARTRVLELDEIAAGSVV